MRILLAGAAASASRAWTASGLVQGLEQPPGHGAEQLVGPPVRLTGKPQGRPARADDLEGRVPAAGTRAGGVGAYATPVNR
jgi:hypothetical protein